MNRLHALRRGLLSGLALVALALLGCAQPGLGSHTGTAGSTATEAGTETEWQWLAPGLRYAKRSPWPDSLVHVLQLDLREPGLRVQVSGPEQRGTTLAQLAGASPVLASVNASFFGRGHVPRGHTVSDGQTWHGVLVPQDSPLLACDRAQRCQIVMSPGPLPDTAWFNAVAGTPWLLRAGVARQASDDTTCAALCAKSHPRTALGLDASGRWLTIVLVEGRRGAVAGVRLAPLASWLASLGVFDAINLDGGGSSSLWLRGRAVMGRPFNESAERPLANALHILDLRPTGLSDGEAAGR